MKEAIFTKQTSTLQEGEYVMIQLNKKFLIKQLEDKQKMKEQAQSKKGTVHTKPLGIPSNYKIDPPSFVVGKVSEVLMSLVYLVDAWEERATGPTKKGYEYRELLKVSKISEDQYKTSVAHFQTEK